MTAIYFDLDGTLTDPKPGITRSIQYALGKLDRAVPAEDELTWCIGPPLHASLKKLLGTDDLADRALLLYRERFADIGIFENQVYPGIEDTCPRSPVGPPPVRGDQQSPRLCRGIIDHFKCGSISSACSVPNWTAGIPTRPACWAMRCSPRVSTRRRP